MMQNVVVTQADRDAAASCMAGGSTAMREGKADNDLLVQAFARHRTNAVEPWVVVVEGLLKGLGRNGYVLPAGSEATFKARTLLASYRGE